jgi:peptide/nickel transport system permease protein
LPPGSYTNFSDNPLEWLRRLVLPALTLSLFGAATQTRFIRSGLLETLHQDYIRTARAKGFNESAVILRHALRNALIPSITLLGLQFGSILEGAFIVEFVFAWPGIGRLGFQALGARDYPTVQAVVFLAVFLFLFANLIVDLAYAYLDPRISLARARS